MRSLLCVTTALAVGGVLAAEAGAQDLTLSAFGGVTLGMLESETDYNDPPDFYIDTSLEGELDAGWTVGGAAGVSVADFTIEAELAYRTGKADEAEGNFHYDVFGYVGDIPITSFDPVEASVVSVMANGWYNVPFGGRLVGYAGGGIGLALAEAEIDGVDYEGDPVFAWQLGLGLAYKINEQVRIGGGYRYFDASDVFEETYSVPGIFETTTGKYTDSSVLAEVGFTF